MLTEPAFGRSDLPRLFALLDRAAESLLAPPIDDVVINHEANASYERLGWRRRRVLTLGLPLFLSLEPPERIALLGHEIAHGINGDTGRLLLMSGGAAALLEAYGVLEPDSVLPSPSEGLVGYLVIPFRIVQLGFARAILGLAYVQIALCYRTAQRAEYYADALSARLAGSSPVLNSFTRFYASRWAVSMNLGNSTSDPVGLSVEKIRSLPPRELQRLRRVEELSGASLRATHPPIFYRERVVSGRPAEPGRLHLGTGESDAIDRELERFRAPIGRKMVDEYLSSIS
jgi:heat shock protein HtpX